MGESGDESVEESVDEVIGQLLATEGPEEVVKVESD